MIEYIEELQEVNNEAQEILRKGTISRPAQLEKGEEFPLNHVNMFKIFLNYGPFLYEEFFRDDNWGKLKSQRLPPIPLKRFFRVLVISHYFYQNEESTQHPQDTLKNYVSIMRGKFNEWSPYTEDKNKEKVTSSEYIQKSIELRVLLHQLAEFEFIGEHNWEFWTFSPISMNEEVVCHFEYNDWNPLQNRELPHYKIRVHYPEDANTEYDGLRGTYTTLPPISNVKGAIVITDEGQLTSRELSKSIDRVRERLNTANQVYREKSQSELELYFANCHLLPLFLKQDKPWPDTKLHKDIRDAILNNTFASRQEEYSLNVLNYYNTLSEGIQMILNDVE